MLSFVLLLRKVYSLTRDGQLDAVSVLNAFLSKEPYHELSRLLLNRYLESPNIVCLVHDVNYQNQHGWALIHFAAYTKNLQLMHTCIKNHADLTITDYNGNTALHIAIQVAQKNRSIRCAQQTSEEMRVEKSDDNREYLEIVKLILKNFKQYNEQNKRSIGQSNDWSNEHKSNDDYSKNSMKNNHWFDNRNQQINLLVNKQNVFGKTALHYAIFLRPDRFSIELLHMLREAKANADLQDYRGCTPLYYLLAEHRSRNDTKKYSKNCNPRSPFINLLVSDFKCDRLHLDELDYGISSLQQLCRKTIQEHLHILSNHQRDTFRTFIHEKYRLPVSLCNYLSRRTL